MKRNIITIWMPQEDSRIQSIELWAPRFNWNHVKELHFVHIVKQELVGLEYGVIESPTEKIFQLEKEELKKKIYDLKKVMFPNNNINVEVFQHIEMGFSQEKEFLKYISEFKTDLVVIPFEKRKGVDRVFNTSFTDFITKWANCDILLIK